MKEFGITLIIFSIFVLLSNLLAGRTGKYVKSYKEKKITGENIDDKEKWMYAISLTRKLAFTVLLIGFVIILLSKIVE